MRTGSELFANDKPLRGMPVPAGIRAHIASYAAYTPTPSAVALEQHMEAHPWINDVIAMYPDRHPGRIIMGAPFIGLGNCWKCDACSYAKLYQIRRRYEPDPVPEGTMICDL